MLTIDFPRSKALVRFVMQVVTIMMCRTPDAPKSKAVIDFRMRIATIIKFDLYESVCVPHGKAIGGIQAARGHVGKLEVVLRRP